MSWWKGGAICQWDNLSCFLISVVIIVAYELETHKSLQEITKIVTHFLIFLDTTYPKQPNNRNQIDDHIEEDIVSSSSEEISL